MIPNDPGFYKVLLDNMSDGVYFVDRDRKILYWNEGARRLTGYDADEILGQYCQDDILCHVDDHGHRLCHDGCPLTKCIDNGDEQEATVFLRHKLGRRVPVLVRVQPIRGTDGSISGAVEIFSDNSVQNDALRRTEELRKMAFLDHLTQLPNRRFVEMSVQTALSEYQLHQNPFGLLVIDIDRFKEINDAFGHTCGDRILQEAAKTLVASLRPSDIVGRWGGDEFVAIVRGVGLERLKELADRCVAISAQTEIPRDGGISVCFSISVGATTVRLGDTPQDVFKRADQLLYKSKASGRSCATSE